MKRSNVLCAALIFVAACKDAPTAAAPAPEPMRFSAWSAPVWMGASVNSTSAEFHPAISDDGLTFFFASNRPGGAGRMDLWYAERPSRDSGWSAPKNFGTLNTAGGEFSPMLAPDRHSLFFATDGRGNASGDIYVTNRDRVNDNTGWQEPVSLGSSVNSLFDDEDPTVFADPASSTLTLYFTSLNRPDGPGDYDLYTSSRGGDGKWTPATLVAELSTPARETHPTIRRDGLEMIFVSDRAGGVGSLDLWVSTRATTKDKWSTPQNLSAINTTVEDRGPSLSSDGQTLYFASNRPGGIGATDFWMCTRTRLP
ncbi:MAG TPA: hypothetical protein VIF32_00410 [Gemmatimonadaceae bacterium]